MTLSLLRGFDGSVLDMNIRALVAFLTAFLYLGTAEIIQQLFYNEIHFSESTDHDKRHN